MNDATTPDEAPQPAPLQDFQRTDHMAVFSMVVSFLGLAMLPPVIGSVLGIVFGGRAAKRIEKTGQRGAGAAQAAVVFGWFGVIESAIVVIFVVIIIVAAARSGS